MNNNQVTSQSSVETVTSPNEDSSRPDSRISHILPGTEGMSYYTCRWCQAEIKNSYFKYLKHHAACPRLRRPWATKKNKSPLRAKNQPKGPSQGQPHPPERIDIRNINIYPFDIYHKYCMYNYIFMYLQFNWLYLSKKCIVSLRLNKI
jgi:hypothetical protein